MPESTNHHVGIVLLSNGDRIIAQIISKEPKTGTLKVYYPLAIISRQLTEQEIKELPPNIDKNRVERYEMNTWITCSKTTKTISIAGSQVVAIAAPEEKIVAAYANLVEKNKVGWYTASEAEQNSPRSTSEVDDDEDEVPFGNSYSVDESYEDSDDEFFDGPFGKYGRWGDVTDEGF